MEDPRKVAAATREQAEVEADSIMEEFAERAPSDLADELRRKREVYDEGADFAFAVAAVLRERQAEWLKGRRWPERREATGGVPKLTRTSDHAQISRWGDDA